MPNFKHLAPALVNLVVLAAGQSQFAIAADAAIVEKGNQLYSQNCSVCHQPDAIGKPGFAPSLTNKELLSISSDKFLLGTIRDGRAGTGMPPFAHLGRKNAMAIVAYLRSHTELPNTAAEVDAQPAAQGDPRLVEQHGDGSHAPPPLSRPPALNLAVMSAAQSWPCGAPGA